MRYLPAASSSGNANSARSVSFAITTTTASSSALIPADADVHLVMTEITTPYSAGGTLDVGDGTDVDLVHDQLEIDAQTAAIYRSTQDTEWPLGTAVTATVGGAPAAGAATVTVFYSTPSS